MQRSPEKERLSTMIGRTTASLPARAREQLLRLEGSADINAEMAEIGLSVKSGWYASVVLYGSGGLVTVIAGLLLPQTVPLGVTLLGCFAMLLSGLAGLAARYVPNADWATHMRLIFGLLIFLVGAFVAGDLRVAFVMLPLFVLITPTFLYGTRFAIPYVAVTTPVMAIVVLVTPGPSPIAHAVVSAGAMLGITLSLMIAERRTRSLARANRRLAYTDALTGIANMRRLRETLAAELGQPVEGRPRFALYAIDLDNFKLVNDTFDHSVGDQVLIAVANALEEVAGPEDLVARRGGDEFSLLVRQPQQIDLDEFAEQLGVAIRRAREETCPQITPSGSVAWVTSRSEDSISSVLQRADDELHDVKQAFHAAHGTRDEAAAEQAAARAGDSQQRINDRDAALRSVSAAVNRAYEEPQHGRLFNEARELAGELGRRVRRLELSWAYLSVTVLLVGVSFFVMSAVGLLAPLTRPLGMGMSAALIVIGLLALQAARRNSSRALIPAAYLLALIAFSIAVASAGETGTALLDAYVMLGLFGFYFMRPRVAAVFLVFCAAMFVSIGVAGNFPDIEVRSAITVAVMIVAAAIIVKVSDVTVGFVRKNRELSEVDPLTGVANLRALKLRVRTAIERHQREGGPQSPMLMTIDLDRFKLVNDNYNHTVGDQMLESVARAISECVRIEEMVARRGGDEFFVLFESTTPGHIESVIPRVRAAVSHARRRICPDLTPTASVGYVAWHPGQSAAQFLTAADGVMHDEKIETRQRNYAADGAEVR